MRNVLFLGVIALAAGCKAPPDAPTGLEDLSLFLFANYGNEDEEVLAVGIQNLDTFLNAPEQDMTANSINDRSATLPTPLEGENLGGVVPVEGADPAVQENLSAWALSAVPYETHKEGVSDPNQVCAGSDSTKYSARTFVTSLPDWESGDARTLETTNENRTETPVADVWMDVNSDFRVVELEDGREAMISRGVMPEKAIADNPEKSWDQRYTIDVWIPTTDGASTERYYAMWSSATIGVGSLYAGLVKGGMEEYFINTDVWFLDGECHTDRDRPYDRP